MLIGYARVFTQETREESPEKRRRTPLTTFWAAETQLGTHSLCQEPSETGTLSLSTLVRNAPLSVQNRTNLPDTLTTGRATWRRRTLESRVLGNPPSSLAIQLSQNLDCID